MVSRMVARSLVEQLWELRECSRRAVCGTWEPTESFGYSDSVGSVRSDGGGDVWRHAEQSLEFERG